MDLDRSSIWDVPEARAYLCRKKSQVGMAKIKLGSWEAVKSETWALRWERGAIAQESMQCRSFNAKEEKEGWKTPVRRAAETGIGARAVNPPAEGRIKCCRQWRGDRNRKNGCAVNKVLGLSKALHTFNDYSAK